MIIRECASFFFVLFFVPFGIGCGVLPKQQRLLQYICGFAVSLTVFEAAMLLFHATGASLRLMVIIWCVVCLAGAGYGFWQRKKHFPVNGGTEQKRELDGVEALLFILVLLAVIAVTLNTVLNTTYVNWDDQTYCTNAVSSWQSDLVNRLAPHSGSSRSAFYDKKYVIAGWPIYSSMLAVLSGIHPAIIFRTLLPIFEIPAAFAIIYLLLYEIFPQSRKKVLLGVLYYIFFSLAVSEKMGGSCSEWWLFVNCWTGKALSFNIVVPLVLWLLFRLEKEKDVRKRRAYWIILFFVGCSSCNIAATMFMIFPIEVGVWGLFYLYRTRRWKDIYKFALCALPTMMCALWTML